jgi:hypothetical protein
MKKSQELELQVEKLQEEINKLKRMKDGIPLAFHRDNAIRYLGGRDIGDLGGAFVWEDTLQGHDYWEDIYEDRKELSKDDIIQIQEWIIRSYAQEK